MLKNSKWPQTLQKCQNRLLKFLFNKNKLTNTNLIHKQNNILKVLDLANLKSLLISHKVIHYPNQKNTTHNDMIINTYSGRALRTINSFVLTTECYNRKNKITENAKVKWNELSVVYDQSGLRHLGHPPTQNPLPLQYVS